MLGFPLPATKAAVTTWQAGLGTWGGGLPEPSSGLHLSVPIGLCGGATHCMSASLLPSRHCTQVVLPCERSLILVIEPSPALWQKLLAWDILLSSSLKD